MSSLRSRVVFLVLSALTLACSGIKVDSEYDPSADFSQLRSWAWLPQAGPSDGPMLDNAPLDTHIREAVKSNVGYANISPTCPPPVFHHWPHSHNGIAFQSLRFVGSWASSPMKGLSGSLRAAVRKSLPMSQRRPPRL